MPYINFNTNKKITIWEGITASLHHSEQATFAHVTLEKDSEVGVHNHIHEQWTHVIEGELLFDINGEQKLLTSGMTAFMPSGIPHAAKAITTCKVIDCFLPVRQDFVALEKETV
jgi:quercetin dioxygenase-like cupin family protein